MGDLDALADDVNSTSTKIGSEQVDDDSEDILKASTQLEHAVGATVLPGSEHEPPGSQTVYGILKYFWDNVTRFPEQAHYDMLRAKLSCVPGGEAWTQGKLSKFFRNKRRSKKMRSMKRPQQSAATMRHRQQLAEDLVAILGDVLPHTPTPDNRTPKTFAELAKWLEEPNTVSLEFLKCVAAGSYSHLGLVPKHVVPRVMNPGI